MRQWSENEVFDFLVDHFRKAADLCEALAVKRAKGGIYNDLRKTLEKIEDMCRVVHYMRQDARWLKIGIIMERAHQQAGDWLRGIPQKPNPDGSPRPALMIPDGERHPLFMKLAEYLREQEREAIRLKNERTGRVGMILPRMLTPPSVGHRPVTVKLPEIAGKSKGGILLPKSP